jgi:hypothetical protein
MSGCPHRCLHSYSRYGQSNAALVYPARTSRLSPDWFQSHLCGCLHRGPRSYSLVFCLGHHLYIRLSRLAVNVSEYDLTYILTCNLRGAAAERGRPRRGPAGPEAEGPQGPAAAAGSGQRGRVGGGGGGRRGGGGGGRRGGGAGDVQPAAGPGLSPVSLFLVSASPFHSLPRSPPSRPPSVRLPGAHPLSTALFLCLFRQD